VCGQWFTAKPSDPSWLYMMGLSIGESLYNDIYFVIPVLTYFFTVQDSVIRNNAHFQAENYIFSLKMSDLEDVEN